MWNESPTNAFGLFKMLALIITHTHTPSCLTLVQLARATRELTQICNRKLKSIAMGNANGIDGTCECVKWKPRKMETLHWSRWAAPMQRRLAFRYNFRRIDRRNENKTRNRGAARWATNILFHCNCEAIYGHCDLLTLPLWLSQNEIPHMHEAFHKWKTNGMRKRIKANAINSHMVKR